MDPLSIASTGLQIGMALSQASDKSKAEKENAAAIRKRKYELETRSNINILNRKQAALSERAGIAMAVQGAGFKDADSELLASSMSTEITDITNMKRELEWEKTQLDIEASQGLKRADSYMTGGILSSAGTLLSLGASEYKNNPSFTKAVDNWWLDNTSWSIA